MTAMKLLSKRTVAVKRRMLVRQVNDLNHSGAAG
jgi:hypothetical protein